MYEYIYIYIYICIYRHIYIYVCMWSTTRFFAPDAEILVSGASNLIRTSIHDEYDLMLFWHIFWSILRVQMNSK